MDFVTMLEKIFSESGIFAALSVGLVFWESKTNQDREKRYIDTINNITVNVSEKLINVESDVQDIKIAIKERN